MGKRQFLVYPNPFIHLDHDGYPAGATPCDRLEHVGITTRKWVGAELDAEQTKPIEQFEPGDLRTPRQITRFRFHFAEPTALPTTPYYADRIRDGELIAADEATARYVGVKFRSPADALAAAKDKAIADWQAREGEAPPNVDAFDTEVAKAGKPTPKVVPAQASAPVPLAPPAAVPNDATHEGSAV